MDISKSTQGFLSARPRSIEGCGMVQFLRGDTPATLCILHLKTSPLGPLCECVLFEDFKHNETGEFVGFSDRPQARPNETVAHAVALMPSQECALKEYVNVAQKSCVLFSTLSQYPDMRFEIVAARIRPKLPLNIFGSVSFALSNYCEARFGADGSFRGSVHRASLVSEIFEAPEISELKDAGHHKAASIAVRMHHASPLQPSTTYIIDHFSGTIPALKAHSIFAPTRNKKVASSFACDSQC